MYNSKRTEKNIGKYHWELAKHFLESENHNSDKYQKKKLKILHITTTANQR